MKAHYLFSKTAIPRSIPAGLNAEIERLKALKTQEEVLIKAYSLITKRFEGRRLNTYFNFFRLFSNDLGTLWESKGFMHCTNQNYLLALLLVKSKFFSESDIDRKWSLYWWISPHQYLRIKIERDKFINADPWSASYGIGLGDYAHGFHTRAKIGKL